MAFYDASSRYKIDESNQAAFRQPLEPVGFLTYTVREGDSLETISRGVLGTARRYWEIADINPQIKFPLDLTPGAVIRIPS